MAFCCGTDMLLTLASLRQDGTTISNVPVLFCAICEKLKVHPDVELPFELLVEYAVKDRAREVDLKNAVHPSIRESLYDPKNHADYRNMSDVLKQQIDHALDLYSMADRINDPDWKQEIVRRLTILHHKTKP